MTSHTMHTTHTSKYDWGLFFGGLLVALCGIAVIFWPGATLELLAIVAGVGFLFAGVLSFITWIRTHNYVEGSGWTLANAVCDVILGVMFLVHPFVAAGVITFLVGCFAVAYGAFAIASAFSLRKTTDTWWVMLLNGIMSILCGWFFIFSPEFFAIFLGVFVLMQGVTMSIYGIAFPNNDIY